MSLISKIRKQKAIYWKLESTNSFGEVQFSDRVEIDCRWDDEITELIDEKGIKKNSKALVYVDRVMQVGDLLYRGSEEDFQAESNPTLFTELENTTKIIRFTRTPNLKATEELLIAYVV